MRGILNILWAIIGGGFLIWLQYIIGGLILCLTIVGIPFGLQCFKLANLGLFPFGKDFDHDRSSAGGKTAGLLLNVFWFCVAGVWIFLAHIALAVSLGVTIIGIPFAIQHLKLAMLALAPFGKTIQQNALTA